MKKIIKSLYYNALFPIFKIIDLIQEYLTLERNNNFKRLKSGFNEPKSLIPFGCKIYSQNEEDGIIAEIFKRIGTTNKLFVEIGVGTGLENNTLALLFQEWSGLWVDSSARYIKNIKNGFKKTISNRRLNLVHANVTIENVNEIITTNFKTGEIDLLSIDIDGNDYHILKSINCVKPRVIVIEYNPKFPPPIVYCMEYDNNHCWDLSDNYGSSLKFLEIKLKEKGYALVCCNLTGVNAFFVREDLVQDRFLHPFTAEKHYQPARHELVGITSGHYASYETLENNLLMNFETNSCSNHIEPDGK